MKSRTLIVAGVALAAIAAVPLGYAGLVLFGDPLANTEDEAVAMQIALDEMGLETVGWRTTIVSGSGRSSVPPDVVWRAYQDLDAWSQWSVPLHDGARWNGETRWEVGSGFTQDLDLGMAGKLSTQETLSVVQPGRVAMWCKDQNGVHSCHVWTFKPTAGGGTFVSNVEVFQGATVAVMRPLMLPDLRERFQASVDGLIRRAEGP